MKTPRADEVAEMHAGYADSMVVTAPKPAPTEDERLATQVRSALAGSVRVVRQVTGVKRVLNDLEIKIRGE
jgi:osmotically-inducible protein OsmY